MGYFYNATEWMVKKWLWDEIYFQNFGSSGCLDFQLNNVRLLFVDLCAAVQYS
jgi:hypothetical protein